MASFSHYAPSYDTDKCSKRPKGVFLSLRLAIGLAIGAVGIVIIVGCIVRFSSGSKCQEPPAPTASLPTDAPSESRVTSAAPDELTDFRLSTDVKPIHYSLILAPFIYADNISLFYFTGRVEILIRVQRTTNVFCLHTNSLNISAPSISDNAGNLVIVSSVLEDKRRMWQTITMDKPLVAGNTYTVVIDRFRGPLKSDLAGLYVGSYIDNATIKYLVTSQMEPTDARKVLPCFDEPSFKATFAISIVRRQDFKAISNMPTKLVSAASAKDWFIELEGYETLNLVKEDFHTSPVMPSYLLAFLVSQFVNSNMSDRWDRRYYRTWTRPDLIESAQYASRVVANVTEYFEGYLNITYPLQKTDQAAVPDFAAGAMENWGLVLYKEIYLLYNSNRSSAFDMQYIARIVSHEMAHMWFGNIVTMEWWDDIWLNEAFASFFEIIGVEHLHPDWDFDSQFVANRQALGFVGDSRGSSHPIYVQPKTPAEVNQVFNSITYNKGSAILRMIYNSIGTEVFRIGVSRYLRQSLYSNTIHSALYQSLSEQAREMGVNIDVGEIMDRWIKQMGYPVVNCTRAGSDLLLSQQHFLSDPTQTPDPRYPSQFNFTWIIPITMITKSNSSGWDRSGVSHLVQWMRSKSQRFSSQGSSDWYLLNLRSTGFYRVNYDANNWKALINQLVTDHTVFTPHDRARLLDDSFTLASAGYISYEIPMEMSKYLRKEEHLVPWQAALSKFAYIRTMLVRQSSEYGAFRLYMRSLLQPIYDLVGFEKKSDDSHMRQLTRDLIVPVSRVYGVKGCKQYAGIEFDKFVNSSFTYTIDADIRGTVFCVGIENSDSEMWNKMFEFQSSESHPGVKNDVIRALSCSREPWVLTRYLRYTLDEIKVRKQDVSTVISGVSSNPIGLQIVWDFLRSEWDLISSRQSGLFNLERIVKSLEMFNTDLRYDELVQFRDKHNESLKSASRAIAAAIDNVRKNIIWMKRYHTTFADFLTSA